MKSQPPNVVATAAKKARVCATTTGIPPIFRPINGITLDPTHVGEVAKEVATAEARKSHTQTLNTKLIVMVYSKVAS